MNNEVIQKIQNDMYSILNAEQMKILSEVLISELDLYNLSKKTIENTKENEIENAKILEIFKEAKSVEGCSINTLNYYYETIYKALNEINKNYIEITTDDLRLYLSKIKEENNLSMTTADNIRRILASFFNWLEDEDYIIKSPVRRIHKIKTLKSVKETFSDEDIEKMRDSCKSLRDLAIIEILISTGMRVGELVKLNKMDIDFSNRSGIVLGKGNAEREIYFDAKAKLHLQEYLNSRNDENEALFISSRKPFQRLSIAGIELILKKIGKQANVENVYPHKFRRTLATMAIDKGMPIEQVQKLLGHVRIDTTMYYAMVNQNNVKISHRRYIG